MSVSGNADTHTPRGLYSCQPRMSLTNIYELKDTPYQMATTHKRTHIHTHTSSHFPFPYTSL